LLQATKGLSKCLDDEKPLVKLEAALSLSQFLEVKQVKEICKPELEKIVEKYLNLIC
jgi:hypothetical protein